MDNLEEVYNDLIMEHSMNSYNKKNLEDADYCELIFLTGRLCDLRVVSWNYVARNIQQGIGFS